MCVCKKRLYYHNYEHLMNDLSCVTYSVSMSLSCIFLTLTACTNKVHFTISLTLGNLISFYCSLFPAFISSPFLVAFSLLGNNPGHVTSKYKSTVSTYLSYFSIFPDAFYFIYFSPDAF